MSTQAPARPRSAGWAGRAWPWLVRLLWLAAPFTVGEALAQALADAGTGVQAVAAVGSWAAWASGLAATFVAHPVSLTTLRVLAPAALAAAGATALAGAGTWPLALAWAGVAAGATFAPGWGTWCVNGPAYPNERRLLLRPPAGLLAGPLALAWALVVAGAAAGPLLAGAGRWLPALPAAAVGWPVAVVLARALHLLARRWVVFVPAGMVVHDPMTLDAPVLLARGAIARLGPAPAGTEALDLTQRTPGLVLEVRLDAPVDLVLVRPGSRSVETVSATGLLLAPTRPGALLEEARRRRIAVG